MSRRARRWDHGLGADVDAAQGASGTEPIPWIGEAALAFEPTAAVLLRDGVLIVGIGVALLALFALLESGKQIRLALTSTSARRG